jgi:hypothetical protein
MCKIDECVVFQTSSQNKIQQTKLRDTRQQSQGNIEDKCLP